MPGSRAQHARPARLGRQARPLEQLALPLVRARFVAARGEGRPRRRDPLDRLDGVRGAFHVRGVSRRPRDHEVVLREGPATGERSLRDELLLGLRRVRDHQIGVAAARHLERRAAAHRDHLHPDPGAGAEGRQELVEEPGVAHAGGGGQQQLRRFRARGRSGGEQRSRGEGGDPGGAGRNAMRGSFGRTEAQARRAGAATAVARNPDWNTFHFPGYAPRPPQEAAMQTELCKRLGIEFPIFAFTHCRDVVVAVSKAGGLGVLGAVGFTRRAARDRARVDRRAHRRQALWRRHRDPRQVRGQGRRPRRRAARAEAARDDPRRAPRLRAEAARRARRARAARRARRRASCSAGRPPPRARRSR